MVGRIKIMKSKSIKTVFLLPGQSCPGAPMSKLRWPNAHSLLHIKPSDMSLTTWSALLKRSKGECEINCQDQCDTTLEVDHHNSRGLGGETSLANCRLICASKNRSRGMARDPKWKEKNYFDGRKGFDGLRKMQNECGPAMAQRYADLFVGEGL